jgi:hypothetical protein
MAITGKLFGAIGNAAAATPAPRTSETALPGYRAWYSQVLAWSYAARRRDAIAPPFVPVSPRFALSLAA